MFHLRNVSVLDFEPAYAMQETNAQSFCYKIKSAPAILILTGVHVKKE